MKADIALTEYSEALESVIRQQFTGSFKQVSIDYNGHDTFSAIMDKNWYIVSILRQDFPEVTEMQSESYQSFLRNCINGQWKLLILGTKGNDSHVRFMQKMLPNKIQGITCKYLDGISRARQVAKEVSNFLYNNTEISSLIKWSKIRCIDTVCTCCGEKLYIPTDIVFYNKEEDETPIGYLPIRQWTENILSNVKVQIPTLTSKTPITPLIFNKLPSSQFEFMCPRCAEQIQTPTGEEQPIIYFLRYIPTTYDDLCKLIHR